MWELDGHADNVVDRLVINTGDAEISSDGVAQRSDTDLDARPYAKAITFYCQK
jgi:hypothetical protein